MFFATSGVVGVVYGFISPEWPLTQLSVGLTGKLAFTRHCQLSLFILRRSHDGVWRLLHLSPVRVRDIPNSDQGPGEIPDNMQTLLGLLHTLHLTFALQSFIKSAKKLLCHDYKGVALTEIVGGIAIFTSPLVVYLVSKTLIPRRHENFPLSFKDIR